MRKILLMAAATVVSAFCYGQVPELAPPAEMTKFGWMVGEWTSKSTWSMPGMPPMNVTASLKAEWDGQFLRQKSVSNFDGMMEMTETMMLGYDPEKQQYVSYSFTNFSPTPRIEKGTLKGDVLTMVSDPWNVMGDQSVSRATLSKVSNDEMKFKLEFKEGDGWTVVSEAVFTRVKK